MPRKKNQDQNVSTFSDDQNPDQDQPIDQVDIQVDDHSNNDDLLTSASRLIGGVTKPLSKNQRYKLNKKAKEAAKGEDFSTIIVTIMTLALSAWNVPDDLKPNDDELQAFSVPATRMLLRHVPITAKLSADALDVIGMIGAMSGYYARTRKAWTKYQESKAPKINEGQPIGGTILNDGFPSGARPFTPTTEEAQHDQP